MFLEYKNLTEISSYVMNDEDRNKIFTYTLYTFVSYQLVS